MTHVAYRGKMRSFDAMIRYARMKHSPTTGEFAAIVWELCSGKILSAMFARELYLQMGYKPFAGYPLERSK